MTNRLFAPTEFDRQVAQSVYQQDEYRLGWLATSGLQARWALDVGAHVGSFTRLVKEVWPECRVIAVEPSPELAPYFAHNTQGLERVHLHAVAIAAHDGPATVELASLPDFGGRYVLPVAQDLTPGFGNGEKTIAVPASRITTILREYEFPPLDVVKLDCEGAEPLILEELQAEGLLARTNRICGEWHHEASIPRIEAALAPTHRLVLYRSRFPWGAFFAWPHGAAPSV